MTYFLVLIFFLNGEIQVKETGDSFGSMAECQGSASVYLALSPPAFRMVAICMKEPEPPELPPMS